MDDHEYAASISDYNMIDEVRVRKVIKPIYDGKKSVIYASCPYCKCQVQRVWNLKHCGNCGERISWDNINVEYRDV